MSQSAPSKLKPCPTCGKDVATSQIKCPHCGEDFKTDVVDEKKSASGCSGCIPKVLGIALIGVVLWLVIAALNDHQNARLKDIANFDSAAASDLSPYGELQEIFEPNGPHTDAQRDKKKREIIGQKIDWTLTVYDVKKLDQNKYWIQTQGSNEVGTEITLRTKSRAERDKCEALVTGSRISVVGKIDDVTILRQIEIDPASFK